MSRPALSIERLKGRLWWARHELRQWLRRDIPADWRLMKRGWVHFRVPSRYGPQMLQCRAHLAPALLATAVWRFVFPKKHG